MNLQTLLNPKDATTLAIERAIAVALTSVIGVVLLNWSWPNAGKWAVLYWVLKSLYDYLVKTIPNWPPSSPNAAK